MGNPSNITTSLTVDAALVQNAQFSFNANDRQYLDNQIRGTQQHVVDLLISGIIGTWMTLDSGSAAVVAGDVVCLSGSLTTARSVTKAVFAPLVNANRIFGVVLAAASPGSFVKVALPGSSLPPTLTGLTTGAGGMVRVNTTTARLQTVTAYTGTDYPAGSIDLAANCTLGSGPTVANVAGALAGDVTGTLAASTVVQITGSTGTVTLLATKINAAGSYALQVAAADVLALSSTGAQITGTLGVGIAPAANKLRLDSAATPNESQIRITAATGGGMSMLTYAADNNILGFDADFSAGGVLARHAGIALLQKISSKLVFIGSTGNTIGNPATTTAMANFDLSNGRFRLGDTNVANALLEVGTSADTTNVNIRVNGKTATTANTGASGAPPAQVVGYLSVNIKGTEQKIPYYAV